MERVIHVDIKSLKTEILLIEGDDYMKPTKSCNCIRCTDCSNYTECVEYEIQTEVNKGKLSYGEIFKTTILQA